MARWRVTADQLADIIRRQGTADRLKTRGQRVTGRLAEMAFSAELDPKPTLQYDTHIKVVDHTGCAIPQAHGKYPRICPYCKREMP